MGLTSRGKSIQWSGVEAKRQLTGTIILPKTCVANRSVELEPQQNKTINSSALTPSLSPPQTLPPNHGPAQGTPLLYPAPPAPIHGPALSASTPPKPGQTDSGSSSPGPTGSGTLTSSCTQA